MRAWPVKTVLPRSLFGRALAILMVPMVVLQLVVGLVFFQRQYQRVTEQLTRGVALELATAIDLIETAPTPAERQRRLGALAESLRIDFDFEPGARLAPSLRRELTDLSGGELARTLRRELARPLAIDLAADTRTALIRVKTGSGVLEALVPRSRLSVSNPHQLLVLMVVTSLVLTTLAVVFLRNQVRPIRALAEAAEAFGKGRMLPFRPTGSEEARRAGAAFLAMRGRLERQIEQRTQMLSGVSHDLRTPLTRMKLTLAMIDDSEELHDLRQDVDQMGRMLDAFLDFARSNTLDETEPTDPFALAEAVAEDARRGGAAVAFAAAAVEPTLVPMRPVAVTRALANLVSNAARHGERTSVSVRLLPKTVDFVVEDDGPGIALPDRQRATQPFLRLDAARNQDSGGSVGLGLSIAMDVARSHGGSLELGDSPDLGGLRAVLRLPR